MFFGWLADRLKGEGAFTVAMSCTMSGYVMLLLLGALDIRWPLYVFILSYGFAQGAGGIAIAAKTVEVFQGPRLGTIFMVVTLSGNLGAAFGAWIGGRFFDLTGSYALTFLTAIVSGSLAIACMWAGNDRRQTAADAPTPGPLSAHEDLCRRASGASHPSPDRSRTTAGPPIARAVHAVGLHACLRTGFRPVSPGNPLWWDVHPGRLGPHPCPDRSHMRWVGAVDRRV